MGNKVIRIGTTPSSEFFYSIEKLSSKSKIKNKSYPFNSAEFSPATRYFSPEDCRNIEQIILQVPDRPLIFKPEISSVERVPTCTNLRNTPLVVLGRVIDHSMSALSITPDDLIGIHTSLIPQPEDIVVAEIEKKLTIGRIFFGKHFIYLVPEDVHTPILILLASKPHKIIGVVTEVLRPLKEKNKNQISEPTHL